MFSAIPIILTTQQKLPLKLAAKYIVQNTKTEKTAAIFKQITLVPDLSRNVTFCLRNQIR